MRAGRILLVLAALSGGACNKQPLINVNASFSLADAVWFAEEDTLFIFYRIDAQQGLNAESQVEVTWVTNDQVLPWTPITQLPPVHTHLTVDCGITSRCGSWSFHLPQQPLSVGLQLRWAPDGALTLGSDTSLYVVGPGPADTNRSLLVYGVFDEQNQQVEWRARHQFPDLHNEQVTALGLRRYFQIDERAWGDVGDVFAGNPYGYAFSGSCPAGLTPLAGSPINTIDRAMFDPVSFPLQASTAPVACARSTVTDAKGSFLAPAIAQKNPVVKLAFPILRSPITENTEVGFLLKPCDRVISAPQLSMQIQRLFLENAPVICIDGFGQPGFTDQLTGTIQDAVNQARTAGKDMVVALALNQDDTTGVFVTEVEQALDAVLVPESALASPRVSGAFLFDSYGHQIANADVARLALWCPAAGGGSPSASTPQNCPVQPDLVFQIGPFSITNLPILPSRDQYLTFISQYGVAQAGSMSSLTFLAPERTPISENVPSGQFGEVTFFNDEFISAAPTDAFSWCPADPLAGIVVFRSADEPVPSPLSELPLQQLDQPDPTYQIGLLWEFPFLLRLQYEATVAGSATAVNATVPFGVSVSERAFYGASLWRTGIFPLSLLQCTTFCGAPTFDSAGVYDVLSPFNTSYLDECYQPVFPQATDGGFPPDP